MFVVLCISTNVSEKSGLPILGVGILCPEDKMCIFLTNFGSSQLNYAAPYSGIL